MKSIRNHQFPVQKARARANEPRHDRGANNKRLPCSEAALVAFTALLTREEFCIWRRVSLEWLKPRVRILPGVVMESQKVFKIHPRSYLDKAIKGK